MNINYFENFSDAFIYIFFFLLDEIQLGIIYLDN